MDSDNETPLKRQRTLSTERKTCIICASAVPSTELANLKDLTSWNTLLKAARIHDFQPILCMSSSETSVPDISYHRECRSTFTHKKTLDKLQAKNTCDVHDSSSQHHSTTSSRKSLSSCSRVYDKVCIFCDKNSKYMRCSKSREPLIQASELRVDEKIRAVATEKMDKKILGITSRELIAAEAHYHKTCYRDYTRKCHVIPNFDNESIDDVEKKYTDAEWDAYQMLFANIRKSLFGSPHVVPMVELTDTLVMYMNELGVEKVKPQTKKHIRRKLEKEFGESLSIFSNEHGKLLVIPDNLSVRQLATEQMQLKEELQSYVENDSDPINLIDKAALYIRNNIKSSQTQDKQTWPPHPYELGNDKVPLPKSLTRFLKTLLTGDKEKPLTSKADRLIKSISQDCIYNVLGGTYYTAKHILLPWAVKTLTGNVEVIRILNRLGHGISYTKLEEIETDLCLLKLSTEDNLGCALPSNIRHCVPTTLAYDNIDRLEETLSGGGSSHRVNGIVVQPQIHTAEPAKETLSLPKQKRRSIPPTSVLLPPYNAGNRDGPPSMTPSPVNCISEAKEAQMKNWIWLLVRQMDTSSQTISAWTGFNILTRDQISVTKDTVGYLPTINAPATAMSTVNEVLCQALKIKESLHLKEIVCVFDQALYAKAAEITWKHPARYENIVLRMGVFHTICNLLGIIGKRFQDCGLRDLAVEAEVIAEGSIDSVMDGRQYNRGVRLHKLLYEALLRLAWKGFYQWCQEKQTPESTTVDDIQILIGQLHQTTTQECLTDLLQNPQCHIVLQLFNEYLISLRTEAGQLAQFWMSYVDMVEILLCLIRSSREGNWALHLHSIRELLPWCFAYDKVNYSRYLSVYYTEMTKLPDDHPDIHSYLVNGGFSVQLSDNNPFARIPVDQTIEETINKDTQTAGGTKGFSLKPSAVSRYYLTAEYRSMCLQHLRKLTDSQSYGISHHDLEPTRIQKDEADVQSLMNLMENEWINPFDSNPSELISISTASAAPPDVAKDLLSAKEKGEVAYKQFSKERIEKQTKKFHEPLQKQNLKTFKHINKQKKAKGSNAVTMLKADHKLFGHMLLIAQSRKLDMQKVFSMPLGPLPWSLGNCDGTLKKTNKAVLARYLEKNLSSAESIPRPSTCIIDGMSLVQKIHGENKTFGELSECLFLSSLHAGTGSHRIDVVFDVYQSLSIKSAERVSRGSDCGVLYSNIVSGQKIKQWRRLLSSPESKTNLVKYLALDWQKSQFREKLGEKVMYVTTGSKCYRLSSDASVEDEALSTLQEEADTRMLLHAKHAAEESSSLIISSDDTDVFVLTLAVISDIDCSFFIKCGTRNRERYIDVGKVAATIGLNVCKALPGMHAFTGCDTVSAFGGRGKINALKLLVNSTEYQDAFTQLGKEWSVAPRLSNILQAFTCRLYSTLSTVCEVNELRYLLFKAKKGAIESGQLPPCLDCLSQHIARANYQAGVWKRCLENNACIPSPTDGHGWCEENGCLRICWMTGPLAPDTVLEFMSCKCATVCKLPSCQCLVNGLKCMSTCRLQTCENMKYEDPEMLASDDDFDDEHDSQ